MGFESGSKRQKESVILNKAELQDPEKVRKAHVEAVGGGASLPTPEGLKDSEIKTALENSLASMSMEDAEEFADTLEDIKDNLLREHLSQQTALERLGKLMAYLGVPLATTAAPVIAVEAFAGRVPIIAPVMLGVGGLAWALSERLLKFSDDKHRTFNRAYSHLRTIQDTLVKQEGKENLDSSL